MITACVAVTACKKGEQGAPGKNGANGPTGAVGAKGPTGTTGATGATGQSKLDVQDTTVNQADWKKLPNGVFYLDVTPANPDGGLEVFLNNPVGVYQEVPVALDVNGQYSVFYLYYPASGTQKAYIRLAVLDNKNTGLAPANAVSFRIITFPGVTTVATAKQLAGGLDYKSLQMYYKIP